jgi:hypothetical protein
MRAAQSNFAHSARRIFPSSCIPDKSRRQNDTGRKRLLSLYNAQAPAAVEAVTVTFRIEKKAYGGLPNSA